MGKVIGVVVMALCLAGVAQAAKKPQPKSFMWTTATAVKMVEGANPPLWAEDGTIDVSRCSARGKGVAKHYVSFACLFTFKPRSLSGDPASGVLFVKVRPVGKGQACVSLTSLASIPQGCLSRGARGGGSRDDASVALAKALGVQMGTSFPYQGPIGCFGYGAGYFECWFGANDPSEPTNGLATVIMSAHPTVNVTKQFSG